MSTSQTPAVALRRRLLLVATLIAALVAIVLASVWEGPRRPVVSSEAETIPADDDLLGLAQSQLAAGQFAQAQETANKSLAARPGNASALLVSAEAATRLGQMEQAVAIYARVPKDQPEEYLIAHVASAEIERVAGSIDIAIKLFRESVQLDPKHPLATQRLADLLNMTGHTVEARPVLMRLVTEGQCRVEHLQWLADPEVPLQVLEYLEESLKRRPEQASPHLGIAKILLVSGDAALALPHLQQARLIQPPVPDIEATWGRALLELDRVQEWDQWLAALPSALKTHPEIWLQQGTMAERRGQKEAACRCNLEALIAAPHFREAAYRAARLLGELGQPEHVSRLMERNTQLSECASVAHGIQPDNPDGEACRRQAELMLSLERDAEALTWAAYAVRGAPANRPWFDGVRERVKLRRSPPEIALASELMNSISAIRNRFPLPEIHSVNVPAVPVSASLGDAKISFVDVAKQVGVDFRYFESPDPTREGKRMFEMTGGGVVVIDFDRDGWPDLYFTQGAKLVDGQATSSYLDQIFRNRGGQKFINVTEATRIVETGYGQGATAGDFNNDGFPDLYVGNFGPNRLFENLGDGTFVEVGLPVDSAWTTSCAIADLNQDSIPDLYDVNYLQGRETWERTCTTPAGLRACTPFAFDAAPDRICLGNGDGTFRDVTATADISPPHGKGLGLLIGPLSENSKLDIFVANDTVANSLFVNDQPPATAPHYQDVAILAGAAFGDDGKPQACMGVAAADFDNNGLLDMLVTNFANESNALYLARSHGSFEDASRSAGIRIPSLPMLGFGTQALDVDLDGDMDLVVANGDIDDFTHEGRPLRMRPQLFLNDNCMFTETISNIAEDYFSNSSAHRGRGLARLDWNQDGREDFVVSHFDESSALVTSRSVTTNRMITVQLVGTVSSRDAIGSVVTLSESRNPNSQRVAFLTTGDGFQAKNESVIRFGVSAKSDEHDLQARWPSGRTSVLHLRKEDTNVFLIEPYGEPALP